MNDNNLKRIRRIPSGNKGNFVGSVTLPIWWIRTLPEAVSHIQFEETEDGRLILTPMILRELVPYLKSKPQQEEPKA